MSLNNSLYHFCICYSVHVRTVFMSYRISGNWLVKIGYIHVYVLLEAQYNVWYVTCTVQTTETWSTSPHTHYRPPHTVVTLSPSSFPQHWDNFGVSVPYCMGEAPSISIVSCRGGLPWHDWTPRSAIKTLLHLSTLGRTKNGCKTGGKGQEWKK